MSRIVPLVKSITDSEIEFQITEEDILNSKVPQGDLPDYQFEDPIAQALKKIGKYKKVYVGWYVVSAYKGPVRHDYQIKNPKEVRNFLIAFDKNWPIDMITVQLVFEGETKLQYGTRKQKPPEKQIPGKVIP